MAIDTTLSVRLGIINHPKRLTLGIWVLADRASFLLVRYSSTRIRITLYSARRLKVFLKLIPLTALE